MKNNDWHEAYFDLVNKVECECVQQGDLVPIWDQFKAMSAELAKFKALAETLAEAVREIKDSWDWWQVDTYDRCSSVVEDAINEALRQYKEARDER